jgi:hypothetical protein
MLEHQDVFLLEVNDMAKEYVEYRNGGYWIANTRVSLDSVVYAFLDGLSPANGSQAPHIASLRDLILARNILGSFFGGVLLY